MTSFVGEDGPTSSIRFTVNDRPISVAIRPDRNLLEVLRVELGLTGTKYGCGEGECGSCTVLLNGRATRSCQVAVGDLAGATVVTVEGLARDGRLTPVQQAFVEVGAFQCGFCTPGMVVAATALLRRSPHPADAEIRAAMDGNVCRCGGYGRILRAIRRAAEISALPPEARG